jgi:iron complex transport system substrate-binding protein
MTTLASSLTKLTDLNLDTLAQRAPATDNLLELADWLQANGHPHLSAIARIELAERLITRRRFLIGAGALSLGVITGCGPQEEAAVAPTATVAITRLFKHALGETEIPAKPQRVALTNDFILTNLLAVGYKPLASGGMADGTFRVNQFDTTGIMHIGQQNQPDLEQLAALNPELIIGTTLSNDIYPKLSQIAPTVIVDTYTTPLREFDKTILDAIGMLDEHEAQVNQYEQRLTTLRPKFNALNDKLTVNVITGGYTEGTFAVQGTDAPTAKRRPQRAGL